MKGLGRMLRIVVSMIVWMIGRGEIVQLYMKYNITVQLQCLGDKDELTWYKELNTDQISGWFKSQEGNITVMYKNVTIQDEGRYTCTKQNKTLEQWWVHVFTEPGFTEINIDCRDEGSWITCHGNGWYSEPKIEIKIDGKSQIPTKGYTHRNENGTFHISGSVPGLPGRHEYECWIEVKERKISRGGKFQWQSCDPEPMQGLYTTDKTWTLIWVLIWTMMIKTIWWFWDRRRVILIPGEIGPEYQRLQH